MTKKEFLQEVENFLEKTGLSATVFGMKAVNDSRFIFMLREGRECREATQEKVFEFMRSWQS